MNTFRDALDFVGGAAVGYGILSLWDAWRNRRRQPPACGHPGSTGVLPCNRPAGHDGDHWYWNHGTGNGDDKFIRWPNTPE